MAHVLAQTRLDTLLDDPAATGGGVAGVLACGLLSALLLHVAALAPADESIDELPFVPGMVLALGSPDAASVTDPNVADPTTPADPTASEQPTEPTEPEDRTSDAPAVTEDLTPPAPRRPTKPEPSPSRSQSTKLPSLPALPKVPPGAPPTAPSRGDPFGDPGGFDDLSRSGDAWARGVLAALEGMDVGTVYAEPIVGTVRFEMTICKDGRVSRVNAKGGSAKADSRDLVLLEVERLKIPRPPAAIAAKMKDHCVKLRHTFSWSTKGTH